MLIQNRNYFIDGLYQTSKLNFRGTDPHSHINKTYWGGIERFKYKQIPHELIIFSEHTRKNLRDLWTHKYSLDYNLRPQVIFKIPDNFPYRGMTPLRSIKKRLKDAEKRIDKTLNHHEDKPKNKVQKFFSDLTGKLLKKIRLALPKDYIDKLKNPEKIERDEALRSFMFDDTKTACAFLDIPHKSVIVDAGRFIALKNVIEKDPELKQYYPDFEKTFSEVLAADIVLKYQSLSGINPSIFNSKLLLNSFKSGARFFLPPVPGIADSLVVIGVTAEQYITGIRRYIQSVRTVNSREFDTVNSVKAMSILPLQAKTVIESIGNNIITFYKHLPAHITSQYNDLTEKISSLPLETKKIIGKVPTLKDLIEKAKKEDEKLRRENEINQYIQFNNLPPTMFK